MNLLRRVGRMSRREVVHRLRTALRTQAQRAAVRLTAPRWDRRQLRHVLHGPCLDAGARTLLARRDWKSLETRVRTAMRQRPSRFVLDPAQAALRARAIVDRWPQAPAEASRDADRILAGRYDLLGYADLALSPEPSTIDWHHDPVHSRTAPRRFWADVPFLDPECGDHKIIWELNRHQHFLRLGRALWLTRDVRYGGRIVAEVQSWMHANPPLVGTNWASMLELGFRSLSWVAGIHFLLGTECDASDADSKTAGTPWLLDMCLAIDRQLTHVEANLSYYFSPNTHLAGEALALYVAGMALPELARSSRWAACGRTVLLREVVAQIEPDGGHVERSTHYHRYMLDFYLLAWQTAVLGGDRDAAAVFRAAVDRLATFMRCVTDAHGRMPAIGDDDGGLLWPVTGRDPRDVRDSLSLAAVLLGRPDLADWDIPEEVYWLAPAALVAAAAAGAGPGASVAPVETGVFPESGFVTVRTNGGDHLVLDAGPHGFRNGGHAHADALSLTMSLSGRPLLVDPGTATYTMDPALRDRMRSSLLHNTVTFDGRSSARPAGPFRWMTVANARLEYCRGNRRLALARASHDGYAPLEHRRTVVYGCGGWLIVDEARATGTHHAEARWHFDPAWTVRVEGASVVRATEHGGGEAFLCVDAGALALIRGAADRSGGWVSPRYGALVPTTTAAVERSLGPGEAMFTWISGGPPPHGLQRLSPGDTGTLGATLEWDGVRIVTVLRPAGHQQPGEPLSGDGYRTDGCFLQYARGARGSSVALVDASRAEAEDSCFLSVVCDDVVPDLYAGFDGVTLDVCASRPPSALGISGGGAAQAERIVLNGVEIRTPAAAGGDAVTLRAADWPAAGGEQTTAETRRMWPGMPSAQPAAS
jgi:hypothetical protein